MQKEALLSQPSVLFASEGEIQYGRARKTVQLQHLNHSEILNQPWFSAFTSATVLPDGVALKKEKIP